MKPMPDSLVNLRRPNEDDITAIEDIAKFYDTPLVEKFNTASVVEINREVKAFVVTRSILEVVLYCRGTDRDKVLALRKLVDQTKADALALGYDQVYVFVEPEFAKILKKSFGFTDTIGVSLKLDL